MAEYIDRNSFIVSQCNRCDGYCDKVDCDCLSCKRDCRCEMIQDLIDFPATDVRENVKGEWIRISHRDCFGYKCSACWEIYNKRKNRLYYCPNCGAKMDREDGGGDG